MELLLLLALLSAQKGGNAQAALQDFLAFYRENRDLIRLCPIPLRPTNPPPRRTAPQGVQAAPPPPTCAFWKNTSNETRRPEAPRFSCDLFCTT